MYRFKFPKGGPFTGQYDLTMNWLNKMNKTAKTTKKDAIQDTRIDKALRLAKKANKIEELKHLDSTGTFSASPNVWTYFRLSSVPQGDDSQSRDGNFIRATSVSIRMNLRTNINASSNERARVVLYIDKQQQLNTTSTLIFPNNSVESFRSFANKERFKILYDKTFNLNLYAINSSGFSQTANKNVNIYRKLSSLKIGFNGANSTDINHNGLYLAVIGSSNAVNYDWTSRLVFRD